MLKITVPDFEPKDKPLGPPLPREKKPLPPLKHKIDPPTKNPRIKINPDGRWETDIPENRKIPPPVWGKLNLKPT